MRVTLKTLATDLGVSPATVSNAYNRPDQLSAALRERILARAGELGYDGPNPAAQQLRSGRAGAIGILLGYRMHYAFSDPFAVEFLAGLSEACDASGTGLVLVPLSGGDEDQNLAVLRRANVDGLTDICLLNVHDVQELARRRQVPFVGSFAHADGDWVAVDDEGAGRLLGEHLARLGHRRVAVVVDSEQPPGAPVRHLARLDPGEEWDEALHHLDVTWHVRVRGVRRAMPDAVMDVIQTGANSVESGRGAATYLTDQGEPPTAIACVSDVLALGALEELRTRGRAVPGDVSVCGVDDIPAAAAAGLTTVRQPIHEKGFRVGQLLLDPALQPRRVMLPIELVVRVTTGPAPY